MLNPFTWISHLIVWIKALVWSIFMAILRLIMTIAWMIILSISLTMFFFPDFSITNFITNFLNGRLGKNKPSCLSVWEYLSEIITLHTLIIDEEANQKNKNAIQIVEEKRQILMTQLLKPNHPSEILIVVNRQRLVEDSFNAIMPWIGKTIFVMMSMMMMMIIMFSCWY